MSCWTSIAGRCCSWGTAKGPDALRSFWKRLRCSGAKIKAVAIDMSPAYIQAMSEHLPRAAVVFDHFHVIKLFNEKPSDLRGELYREATGQWQKQVLKRDALAAFEEPGEFGPLSPCPPSSA